MALQRCLPSPLRNPQVVVQYTYTTVFGWYVTWLLLRTGSLAPPILVHAFCNWLGMPDFGRMVSAARNVTTLHAHAKVHRLAGFVETRKRITPCITQPLT